MNTIFEYDEKAIICLLKDLPSRELKKIAKIIKEELENRHKQSLEEI